MIMGPTVQNRRRVHVLVNQNHAANGWVHQRERQSLGFTIGSLLDAILGTELDRLWYFDGYKNVTLRKTTPGKLLTRLEKKTGLKVMVTLWQLNLHDVVLAVGEEQQ
ncbi:hypothetical protein LTR35_016033 [Friedmanniomyces endolithicus]|uniref:Uncharacterized protein n=1 Tax=Friedmanniomyces endolithicus TaxID=329885 RepID=A0AAN6FFD0_9PEZI|nr:hypothetical protein LTR35_016033 [Friedmanniomyces endolithicus]KAK0271690.1 hypothetical protein LTS00_016529 [Friedmanniomyces endolithicus]KAK0317425.1 hypothetical protein LTR82_011463 [Friedmanniomyces endolithicus]KAK1006213.1 hypothetical protein LTR54_006736 [Friedmanniomyces endolithicus]